MGIYLFRSSSIFDSPNKKYKKCDNCEYKKLPNPNPNNYILKKYERHKNYVLMEINYPDCNNYEGNKILLYKETDLYDLLNQKYIDPHFSENKKFKSPIARFEPTENGWKMGLKLIEALNK